MNTDATLTASAPVARANGAPPSARILVVDDQALNIQVVGGILGRFGYEIVPAQDGPTAFKRLALRRPDLILLDVLMPGMDGLEVCRLIRQNPDCEDIPIIFLSAADDKELIVRALEAGGVDYVTKPFNAAEMLTRVRTHVALKETRDKLQKLAEDKDELLGILAHDLKNHLGGMEMSAAMLRDWIATCDRGKPLLLCENICHTTGQLLTFVREFLANAAADHGIQLKFEPVEIAVVVVSVLENYREAADRKKVRIEAELPEETIFVQADRAALDQVLDNLVSNAVKFSTEGKKVELRVCADVEAAEISVQDEGPGFTPEDQARMFKRYGRLSARPTGGEPSTGLGLSIVRKLAEMMHGRLTFISTPGVGTTFTLRLARADCKSDQHGLSDR